MLADLPPRIDELVHKYEKQQAQREKPILYVNINAVKKILLNSPTHINPERIAMIQEVSDIIAEHVSSCR